MSCRYHFKIDLNNDNKLNGIASQTVDTPGHTIGKWNQNTTQLPSSGNVPKRFSRFFFSDSTGNFLIEKKEIWSKT